MRIKVTLVPVLLGLVAFVACKSKEASKDPNKDNAALQVVFVPSCGDPGDRIQIKVNSDSCRRRDPADPESRTTEVVFSPGRATPGGLVEGPRPNDPYSEAEVSGEARDYTLDVVVPEGAMTGPVEIIGCGNLLDEVVVSSSVFTIPCPPGAKDAGADADSSTPNESWAGELRITYSPVPSPLVNGMAAFYRAANPTEEAAIAQLEANVKKQTLGGGVPVGTCGEAEPSPPDPHGLPQAGIDVGTPLELRESAGGPAILSLNRGDGNFYMGSGTTALTPGGSPYFFHVPGGSGVAMTTLEGLDVPAAPAVMQPAENATISKASDYTITFQPFTADVFVIQIGTVDKITCNVDPQSGSIVVPSAQLSKLPNGFTLFDLRAIETTDHTITIDGQPRRITSFRSISATINATLN